MPPKARRSVGAADVTLGLDDVGPSFQLDVLDQSRLPAAAGTAVRLEDMPNVSRGEASQVLSSQGPSLDTSLSQTRSLRGAPRPPARPRLVVPRHVIEEQLLMTHQNKVTAKNAWEMRLIEGMAESIRGCLDRDGPGAGAGDGELDGGASPAGAGSDGGGASQLARALGGAVAAAGAADAAEKDQYAVFTKAAQLVEGGAKVYTHRVDCTFLLSTQMVRRLLRSDTRRGAGIEADEDAAGDASEETAARRRAAAAARRRRQLERTLADHVDEINAEHLKFAGSPTSVKPEGGAGSTMATSHLHAAGLGGEGRDALGSRGDMAAHGALFRSVSERFDQGHAQGLLMHNAPMGSAANLIIDRDYAAIAAAEAAVTTAALRQSAEDGPAGRPSGVAGRFSNASVDQTRFSTGSGIFSSAVGVAAAQVDQKAGGGLGDAVVMKEEDQLPELLPGDGDWAAEADRPDEVFRRTVLDDETIGRVSSALPPTLRGASVTEGSGEDAGDGAGGVAAAMPEIGDFDYNVAAISPGAREARVSTGTALTAAGLSVVGEQSAGRFDDGDDDARSNDYGDEGAADLNEMFGGVADRAGADGAGLADQQALGRSLALGTAEVDALDGHLGAAFAAQEGGEALSTADSAWVPLAPRRPKAFGGGRPVATLLSTLRSKALIHSKATPSSMFDDNGDAAPDDGARPTKKARRERLVTFLDAAEAQRQPGGPAFVITTEIRRKLEQYQRPLQAVTPHGKRCLEGAVDMTQYVRSKNATFHRAREAGLMLPDPPARAGDLGSSATAIGGVDARALPFWADTAMQSVPSAFFQPFIATQPHWNVLRKTITAAQAQAFERRGGAGAGSARPSGLLDRDDFNAAAAGVLERQGGGEATGAMGVVLPEDFAAADENYYDGPSGDDDDTYRPGPPQHPADADEAGRVSFDPLAAADHSVGAADEDNVGDSGALAAAAAAANAAQDLVAIPAAAVAKVLRVQHATAPTSVDVVKLRSAMWKHTRGLATADTQQQISQLRRVEEAGQRVSGLAEGEEPAVRDGDAAVAQQLQALQSLIAAGGGETRMSDVVSALLPEVPTIAKDGTLSPAFFFFSLLFLANEHGLELEQVVHDAASEDASSVDDEEATTPPKQRAQGSGESAARAGSTGEDGRLSALTESAVPGSGNAASSSDSTPAAFGRTIGGQKRNAKKSSPTRQAKKKKQRSRHGGPVVRRVGEDVVIRIIGLKPARPSGRQRN